MEVMIGSTRLDLVEGDLTALPADAIINPANAELQLGAGVAGAIRQRGGPAIQAECAALAPIAVGQAVLTGGGALPARHVIHAVGPRWGEGDEDEKLARATRASLTLAEERGLGWVAFPALSTGVFGFPIDRCAAIMLGTVIAFLLPGSHLRRVTFSLWGAEAYQVFAAELARHDLGGGNRLPPGPEAAEAGSIVVELLLFAVLRDAIGTDRVRLTLPAPATAGDALAAVVARHPAVAQHQPSLRLAVNCEYADPGRELATGDEVALIPPTCGG